MTREWSAMSMPTFSRNCAGDTPPKARRETLERAKDELRAPFDKD